MPSRLPGVHLLQWLGWISFAVVVEKHGFTLRTVTGRSMQPTLNPDSSSWKDIAIFDRTLSLHQWKHCKRGDIVALRSPLDPQTMLVKRVIALEGDVVQTLSPYPDSELTIPKGHAWVEGDEHYHSQDSNTFGPVSLALIDSRLTYVVWPPSRFGSIHPSSVHATDTLISSPAWRKQMNDITRERWREERVQAKNS